jgi:hypothetical protein
MERIPIRFADQMLEGEADQRVDPAGQPGNAADDSEINVVNLDERGIQRRFGRTSARLDEQSATASSDESEKGAHEAGRETAGPVMAELIATV